MLVAGGNLENGWSDKVIAFDPRDESMEEEMIQLPTPRIWASAAWINDTLYILGGDGCRGTCDTILAVHPSTGIVTDLPTRLSRPLRLAGLAASDRGALLIGGTAQASGTQSDSILRFDPDDEAPILEIGRLPRARYNAVAAWTGEDAYVFGGQDVFYQELAEILRIGPSEKEIPSQDENSTIPPPNQPEKSEVSPIVQEDAPPAATALLLTSGLFNIGTIEPGGERLVPLDVTAVGGPVRHVSMSVVESDGLTIDAATPIIIQLPAGETRRVLLRIVAPPLLDEEKARVYTVRVLAKGDTIESNVETIEVVVGRASSLQTTPAIPATMFFLVVTGTAVLCRQSRRARPP